MIIVILTLCGVVGVGLYFGIVQPLILPLTWRIPTGKEYLPTLMHTRKR